MSFIECFSSASDFEKDFFYQSAIIFVFMNHEKAEEGYDWRRKENWTMSLVI